MINEIVIDDDDISNIEHIMGKDFQDEQVNKVIKELDSCNIIACPGAGKTTTLIAKLSILADKLPSNQGICVLSHTNAARDEIEKVLGEHSSRVLAYPNYIGTIQAFIDKYLAIPAYIKWQKKKIISIDDEQYNRAIKRYSNTWLKHGTKKFIANKNNGNYEVGLEKCRYRYSDFELCIYDNGKDKPFYCKKETDSYKDVKKFKDRLTELGYLTFYDAYALANKYINAFSEISSILSKRFPIVFIDEMQDTNECQLDLINKIFDRSVIQLIGDMNQSIYREVTDVNGVVWQNRNSKTLNISKSYRMSTSIANLCKSIAVTKDENLTGNEFRKNCKNTIFLFNDKNKEKVLTEYCKLIK
ncbi:MAG: UvrD-helicase domain-containing protein, partial [Clostridium sp.]